MLLQSPDFSDHYAYPFHSSRIQKHYNDSAYRKRPRLADMSRPPRLLEKASFAKRPMNEQQAALNLAQFATDNADLNLGADQVQNLVGTLIVSSCHLQAPAFMIC